MNNSPTTPIDPQGRSRSPSHGAGGPEGTQASNPQRTASILQDVLGLLWSSRRAIAWLSTGGAVAGVVAALLWPARYGAFASFIPEQMPSSRVGSALGGFAGELGLSLGLDPGQSSRFYADLLLSRQVMERVLRGAYPAGDTQGRMRDSLTLLEHFGIRGADSRRDIERGVKKLRAAVMVDPDFRTNIVRVTVRLRDRELSAAVANSFVRAVNEFNTQVRQSQASRRRVFIEFQADSAEWQLRDSEARLKGFLEQNRAWQQSPELQYRLGQLQRQVDMDKEVYLTLRRNLETARIDEVNDVPLISVIDIAVPTNDRMPRRRMIAILGLVLGIIAGFTYAYGAWYWQTLHRAPDAV